MRDGQVEDAEPDLARDEAQREGDREARDRADRFARGRLPRRPSRDPSRAEDEDEEAEREPPGAPRADEDRVARVADEVVEEQVALAPARVHAPREGDEGDAGERRHDRERARDARYGAAPRSARLRRTRSD